MEGRAPQRINTQQQLRKAMAPKKKMDHVAEVYDSVTDGLKSLYRQRIRPVEEVC